MQGGRARALHVPQFVPPARLRRARKKVKLHDPLKMFMTLCLCRVPAGRRGFGEECQISRTFLGDLGLRATVPWDDIPHVTDAQSPDTVRRESVCGKNHAL